MNEFDEALTNAVVLEIVRRLEGCKEETDRKIEALDEAKRVSQETMQMEFTI